MKEDKRVDVHLAAPGGQVPSAASKGAPCPDRELLELAAKAAGIELTTQPFLHARKGEGALTTVGNLWNPLTDDGDALRLASVLCMSIKHEDPNAVICGWTNIQRVPFTHDGMGPWFWKEWLRDHANDRAATTRRAIVRAAAEIARSAT